MKKIQIKGIFFVIIFGFILSSSLVTIYSNVNSSTNTKKVDISAKIAGFWDLTGSSIVIDDTDPTKNWTYTALNNDWCSGSGTWHDPYLIENVTIDDQEVDTCLTILNSKTAYFIIRNCTLFNSNTYSGYAGLLLQNVNNGLIINNTCYDCRSGIYLNSNSVNNTIVENNLIGNRVGGLFLSGCGGNRISNNTMNNNNYFGIEAAYSSNGNNITNNIIKHNGWGTYDLPEMSGIMIESSNDNIISDNEIINNNRNAIYLYNDNCYDNIIINNNLSESRIGIRMSYNIIGTLITENIIKENTDYGIYVVTYHPSGNDIYLNWFIDNGIQAYDNTISVNYWDNGAIGNFWSDYKGVDADDNGIGDTPYLIGGDSGGSQDAYPIWYDSPNIKINSPQNLEIFEMTAPIFNVEIRDPNMHKMWYILNSGIQKTLFTTNESINQGLWNSLADGLNTITFYANDTAGNVNSSSVIVIRDTGPPSIIINNPNVNDVFGIPAPSFNVEITDFLLNTTWYTIDNGITNTTFLTNTSISQGLWNNIFNGPVTITFYANDTLGKLNSNSVLVYKDTIYPLIYILEPIWDQEFGEIPPNFSVEVIEANIVEMWYTIDMGLNNYTFTTNGTINQGAWAAVPNGTLTFMVFVKDIAGNINYDQIIIVKIIEEETEEPPIITGYDSLIILGFISIASTLVVIRFRKSSKNNH